MTGGGFSRARMLRIYLPLRHLFGNNPDVLGEDSGKAPSLTALTFSIV